MTYIPDPQQAQGRHLAAMVMAHYQRNPDLVRSLLERAGANRVRAVAKGFRSTCPIHGGNRAGNFAVFMDREAPVFKCYSDCGEHGQGPLVLFPMRKWRLSYGQSIAWLAYWAGLHIDYGQLRLDQRVIEDESMRAWEARMGYTNRGARITEFPEWLVADSRRFYCDYFVHRGINATVLDAFEIGFVPANRWVWPDGEDTTFAQEHRPQKQTGWFEDRVSIPLRDPQNRLIGFAGRRTDGLDHLKYKNLKGTARETLLYGIHQPRTKEAIRRRREVVIVEGYPDVYRGWMHGVFNILAAGGTQFSKEQIEQLAEHDIDSAILYFDGDKAGDNACRKLAAQVSDFTRARVARPPQGQDPDQLITRDAYVAPLNQAQLIHPIRRS